MDVRRSSTVLKLLVKEGAYSFDIDQPYDSDFTSELEDYEELPDDPSENENWEDEDSSEYGYQYKHGSVELKQWVHSIPITINTDESLSTWRGDVKGIRDFTTWITENVSATVVATVVRTVVSYGTVVLRDISRDFYLYNPKDAPHERLIGKECEAMLIWKHDSVHRGVEDFSGFEDFSVLQNYFKAKFVEIGGDDEEDWSDTDETQIVEWGDIDSGIIL